MSAPQLTGTAPMWLICQDCHADYRFDESPSALRCAGCAAWRAWWESRNPAQPEAER